MKKIFFTILLSFSLSADFCEEPAFEDEFEDAELNWMWEARQDDSYASSSSLFTPANVVTQNGDLVVFVSNIGTTDADGNPFRSTSGEVKSTYEFGYGRFEFRIDTAGLDPVTETLHLLWDGDDYYKHHQFLGLEFQTFGFMTFLATTVNSDDEINTFYSTEVDSSRQPIPLNSQPRFFTLIYTEDVVSWNYDGTVVRQETSTTKDIPNQKLKVVMRNWLINELQYNITDSDMPIETKMDYFKFYPVDEGGDSCDPIEIPKVVDETSNETVIGIDKNGTNTQTNYEDLAIIIDKLSKDKNHLIGYSGAITDLSTFESAKVIWVYLDGKWKAYSPYTKIRETLEKYNIEIFTEVPAYTGFWIQK